ncbi:MAG: hypothetical protein HRT68_17220, partial [Flavobacteriaceae bacterium]|nr:hypothetical protein [Flavobacteriaceae bacterium]
MFKRKPLCSNTTFLVILCLIITSIVLFPTLQNDWVNWDDGEYVKDNLLIKELSFKSIQTAFETDHILGAYIPMVLVSWMIDYAIWGTNAYGYHLSNLLIHLSIIVLVFYLVNKMTNKTRMAFIVAILFAVHPMRVEAVAWITARKDLLYTFFFMLGLITYHKYNFSQFVKQKIIFFLLCLIFFSCSLFSKGTAVIFPFILILFDYLWKRNNYKRIVLEKVPFLIIAVFFTILA